MKIAVKAGALIVFIVIMILCVLDISGTNLRQKKLFNAIELSTYDSMKATNSKLYDINSSDELMAELIRNLSQNYDEDSTMTISIINADPQTGIIDVQVDVDFMHTNGVPDTISERKTIIMEEYPVR